MNTYNHRWGLPHIVMIVPEEGRGFYAPVQSCGVCGTERNPISGVVTKYRGGRRCADAEPKDHDLSHVMKRLEEDLANLRSAGERVELHYTGKELPEPAGVGSE